MKADNELIAEFMETERTFKIMKKDIIDIGDDNETVLVLVPKPKRPKP